MADKKYNLAFELTDGTIQNVQFVAPQGESGRDGTGIIRVTTSPSQYTTVIGGFYPTYRIELSTVLNQGKVARVLVGDILAYSHYQYQVGYVDASYVYLGGRISFRGEDGYTPIKGKDYWNDADIAEIKSYVDEAIIRGVW